MSNWNNNYPHRRRRNYNHKKRYFPPVNNCYHQKHHNYCQQPPYCNPMNNYFNNPCHYYNPFMNQPCPNYCHNYQFNQFYNRNIQEEIDYLKWQDNRTWNRNNINNFEKRKVQPFHFAKPPPPPPPRNPPSLFKNTNVKKPFIRSNKPPITKNISTQINKDSKLDDLISKVSKNNKLNFIDILNPFYDEKKREEEEKRKKEDEKEEEKLREGEYPFELLSETINSIKDLIKLGESYDTKYKDTKKKYSLNLKILNNMIEPLKELEGLIGLDKVKQKIFEQIIFYLQDLDNKNYDMLHTVIAGSPGTGKTELGKIIAKIYNKMGILSKGTFKSVKRNDLIGGYLGQTAIKTRKVLDEAKGGVLFIDEAYSLGNKEGKDIYSKECIDTINAFLTEEREDFICIIAGYKNDLEKCFFSYNEGLQRRFNWRIEIKDYSPSELRDIFIKKIHDYQWKIKSEEHIPLEFFTKNKDYFKFNGGDIEILFQKCKIAHSIRVLKELPEEKKKINKDDLENGFKLFLESKNKEDDSVYKNMYL